MSIIRDNELYGFIESFNKNLERFFLNENLTYEEVLNFINSNFFNYNKLFRFYHKYLVEINQEAENNKFMYDTIKDKDAVNDKNEIAKIRAADEKTIEVFKSYEMFLDDFDSKNEEQKKQAIEMLMRIKLYSPTLQDRFEDKNVAKFKDELNNPELTKAKLKNLNDYFQKLKNDFIVSHKLFEEKLNAEDKNYEDEWKKIWDERQITKEKKIELWKKLDKNFKINRKKIFQSHKPWLVLLEDTLIYNRNVLKANEKLNILYNTGQEQIENQNIFKEISCLKTNFEKKKLKNIKMQNQDNLYLYYKNLEFPNTIHKLDGKEITDKKIIEKYGLLEKNIGIKDKKDKIKAIMDSLIEAIEENFAINEEIKNYKNLKLFSKKEGNEAEFFELKNRQFEFSKFSSKVLNYKELQHRLVNEKREKLLRKSDISIRSNDFSFINRLKKMKIDSVVDIWSRRIWIKCKNLLRITGISNHSKFLILLLLALSPISIAWAGMKKINKKINHFIKPESCWKKEKEEIKTLFKNYCMDIENIQEEGAKKIAVPIGDRNFIFGDKTDQYYEIETRKKIDERTANFILEADNIFSNSKNIIQKYRIRIDRAIKKITSFSLPNESQNESNELQNESNEQNLDQKLENEEPTQWQELPQIMRDLIYESDSISDSNKQRLLAPSKLQSTI